MAKILYVTNARLPTEKAHGLQIMKTCEALARSGDTVTLIAPARHNGLGDDPFAYWNIERIFSFRRLFTFNLIRFGRWGYHLQESTFAIVVACTLPRRTYDILYGREEVVLCILSLFGFRRIIWESHDGAWNVIVRMMVRRAKAIAVVSQGLKDMYVEKGVPASMIVVIPNGIDLDAFAHPETKEDSRRRLGLPLDKKIALYIGRLDGWKGTDTLLESSQYLGDEIRVVMIGGDAVQVETLHKQYERVTFLGYRPYSELPDNQSAADVLVVPNTGKDVISVRFTSPLKLIAHLCAHRPIVASDLPSIREIVANDAALLVSPDDAKALAAGIKKVIEDPALGEQLATCAEVRAVRYTWAARADAINDILGMMKPSE